MTRINFDPFPTIFTERLVLRQLMTEDIASLFTIRSNEENNKYIDRALDKTEANTASFIKKINVGIEMNKWIFWGIEIKETKELIGTICLWNFSADGKTVEIGYELSPRFQGKGFMQESIKRVLDYALNKLSLLKIEAYTHKDNLPSIRLLERNKFVLKGSMIKGGQQDKSMLVFMLSMDRTI